MAAAVIIFFPTVLSWQYESAMVVGADIHPIVSCAALTAEHQWEQSLVWLAGFGTLLGHFQMALGLGLDGSPNCVSAREKLV
jgi:hypothetical protein